MMLQETVNRIIQAEVHDHTVPRVMIISFEGYMRPDLLDRYKIALKEAVPAWSFVILQGGQKFEVLEDIHHKNKNHE